MNVSNYQQMLKFRQLYLLLNNLFYSAKAILKNMCYL